MAIIASGGNLIQGSGVDGQPLRNAGAPTTTTFLGVAIVGSRLIDTTNGIAYIATAVTGVAVTWTKVGLQT